MVTSVNLNEGYLFITTTLIQHARGRTDTHLFVRTTSSCLPPFRTTIRAKFGKSTQLFLNISDIVVFELASLNIRPGANTL